MEARQKAWLKQFNPAPRPYMIYCRHPLVSDRYIGAKQFHDHLLIEKREELCAILIALGARRIVWKNTPEWSRNYESPEGMAPALGTLEDTAVFLEQSAQWSHLVQERLLTWSTHANISFLYEDDYGLNDLIIDKILEKIDAHPECLNEYETTEAEATFAKKGFAKTNNIRALQLNQMYKSFHPLRDFIAVTFFSKEDYKSANLLRIRKTWSIDHVEAFLRHVLLDRLVPMFRVNFMTGVMLLKLPEEDAGVMMRRFYMSSREVELLCASLEDLGDTDSLDLMIAVEEAAPEISLANKKRKPGELEDIVCEYENQVQVEIASAKKNREAMETRRRLEMEQSIEENRQKQIQRELERADEQRRRAAAFEAALQAEADAERQRELRALKEIENERENEEKLRIVKEAVALAEIPASIHAIYGTGDVSISGAFKLVMIGQEGCGKTSLFKAFSEQPIDPYESLTVGADTISHSIHNCEVNFTDIGGHSITSDNVIRLTMQSECILFVYDITNMESFEWLASILPDVILSDHSTWKAMAIVGTKGDLCESVDGSTPLSPRAVAKEDVDELAAEMGVDLVFETSALSGSNVIRAFAELIYQCDEMRFSAPSPPGPPGALPGLGSEQAGLGLITGASNAQASSTGSSLPARPPSPLDCNICKIV